MFGRGKKAKVAGKAARGAGKAARGGGKVLLKSRKARKVARGAGKAAIKGGARAITPREPATTRFLKYGFFALAGFAIGALVARSGEEREVSSGTHVPDPDSPAGRRGEAWGSGTPVGTADVGTVPSEHQRPEDPNRTGAEREYSDPSSGPLIGRRHRPTMHDIPEQQEEVEQRIRTRVGEDSRTLGLERLNVEVNDGIADIRGIAPSENAKAAVTDIAENTEGVREVRNSMTFS